MKNGEYRSQNEYQAHYRKITEKAISKIEHFTQRANNAMDAENKSKRSLKTQKNNGLETQLNI